MRTFTSTFLCPVAVTVTRDIVKPIRLGSRPLSPTSGPPLAISQTRGRWGIQFPRDLRPNLTSEHFRWRASPCAWQSWGLKTQHHIASITWLLWRCGIKRWLEMRSYAHAYTHDAISWRTAIATESPYLPFNLSFRSVARQHQNDVSHQTWAPVALNSVVAMETIQRRSLRHL